MCSKPGGDRGPGLTFGHHVKALNSDSQNRFIVDEAWNLKRGHDTSDYDIFWFYAKAFGPQIFYRLKQKYPNKKFVFGPNILLDKPDIGASDRWDEWFLTSVDFDLYIDQVEFYNNHVKKFIREDLQDKSDFLDKCVTFELPEEYIKNRTDEYDCLIYSKKRRYDYTFDSFRGKLISLLEKKGVKFLELTYGSYERQEYFDALLKSKCCVNLSLDECPGIATYESMFMNTPIIGSPHNTPSIFDANFWVHDTDYMTDKYLVRKNDADEKYFSKIISFLNGELKYTESPIKYILRHAGYQRYADDAYKLMTKYCG